MKDNIRGLLNTRPSCILRVFLLAENVAGIVIAPDRGENRSTEMVRYLPKIAHQVRERAEIGSKTVWLPSLGSHPFHSPTSTATIWKLKYEGIISNAFKYYLHYKLV